MAGTPRPTRRGRPPHDPSQQSHRPHMAKAIMARRNMIETSALPGVQPALAKFPRTSRRSACPAEAPERLSTPEGGTASHL